MTGECIGSCSSCNDELCMFHTKNFNKESYYEIRKLIEEKSKSMPAS